MTIGERIRQCRINKGLTQLELAEKLGYRSKSSIAHIENGRDIPRSMVVTLADILDTTPSYLMGWEEKKEESNVAAVYENSTYYIPLFEDVSAGFGGYADNKILEYVPVFIDSPTHSHELFAVRVRGDSMYPKIEDGDVIIVQKTESVDSGAIAVVMIDGEETVVKKFEYNKKRADLISINPEYKDRVFEGEEMKRLRVVGRVFRIIKDV